jgi:prolyl-tRNA synthetase
MVIRPRGYALWEAIQRALDERIKATGHENVYFPLLVPMSLLERERDLVEGFAPEVAVVTHAGGRQLEEPLAVRPTSEALIWATYGKWIQSYRDLPLLYNQWANVVRWELRPRLFLRTTEFLWQEGHTAHEHATEALAEALTVLNEVYVPVVEDVMAIPVLRGRKSPSERFPGAVETFTMEALMRDGKALQAGTSHYLGDGFARAYNVRFSDRSGQESYPFATSWGVSTRLVGALVMTHGDERGLRLPPAVAPQQVVIVPIHRDAEQARVLEVGHRLRDVLTAGGVRAFLDDRETYRPGFKFGDWELKGVPVRLDLGARDLDQGLVSIFRRDLLTTERVPLDDVVDHVAELLPQIQHTLFSQAQRRRTEATLIDPADYEEMRAYLGDALGFVAGTWCGSPECEERVKRDTAATIRCLPLEEAAGLGGCSVCGAKGLERATWAQSY